MRRIRHIQRVLWVIVLPGSCLAQYPAHPRLWKPQLDRLATVSANRRSPDQAQYQKFLADANTLVGRGARSAGVMSMTITAATHGNPTLLAVTETVSWNDGDFAVAGITGSCWTNINYSIGDGKTTPWRTYHAMTRVNDHTLSVAFDSSGCSDWTGTAYGFSATASAPNILQEPR